MPRIQLGSTGAIAYGRFRGTEPAFLRSCRVFGRHTGPIPSDPAMAGRTVYTQAVHILGAPGFALTNAKDLIMGS